MQRYKAVEKYLNNEIKVFGKYFKEMEGSSRLMRGLRVNINNLHIPEDVIQWYVELNSGVSIHSKDDLQLLLLK